MNWFYSYFFHPLFRDISVTRIPSQTIIMFRTAVSVRTLAQASTLRSLSTGTPATASVQFHAGTKLLVCDMAGTTVEEHGAVYEALFKAMVEKGIPMEWSEMHDW